MVGTTQFEVTCVAAHSAGTNGVAVLDVAEAAPEEADPPRAAIRAKAGDVTEAETVAREAGLKWVSDRLPGFGRKKRKDSFVYFSPKGDPVSDPVTKERLKALVIPPAWTGVWIASSPRAHIQATGRDAKGRKQYIYHPKWLEVRGEAKYGRMLKFGRALPDIRQAVRKDLRRHGLARERVTAAVVSLLDLTAVRIGNEEYARKNQSFGLTTLQNRHVKVRGSKVRFEFVGKGGKKHEVDLSDRRMAKVLARCAATRGQRLFQYTGEDGQLRPVQSHDVNAYLREVSGRDFTAKDFRTWTASVLAARFLADFDQPQTRTETKRRLNEMLRSVSSVLGNTPTVCRQSYVHPSVLESYLDGTLQKCWRKGRGRWGDGTEGGEALLLCVLESQKRASRASDTRSKAKRKAA